MTLQEFVDKYNKGECSRFPDLVENSHPVGNGRPCIACVSPFGLEQGEKTFVITSGNNGDIKLNLLAGTVTIQASDEKPKGQVKGEDRE